MRNLLALLLCGLPWVIYPQTNPEVYLVDINKGGDSLLFNKPMNISNNEGYDNQPSFFDDDHLLYASNRKGQTDIKKYKIKNGNSSWQSDTPHGSEYSPLRIKGTDQISAIRLDHDGTQLLYRYTNNQEIPEVLLGNLKVGYHLWFNDHILVTTVLTGEGMDLVVTNFKDNRNYTVQKNVGRSLHKIPNSNLISFISKEKELWTIKSMDPVSGATKEITRTYLFKEDVCWLNDGSLLTGFGNKLYRFHPEIDKNWRLAHVFDNMDIHMISRLAVNSNTTQLALVADISPEVVVYKQIAAFNARDIESYLDTFTDDIKVYGYGGLRLYQGKDMLRKEFTEYFNSNPDLDYSIKDKIVMDNKVHHEAMITAARTTVKKTFMYTVVNGKIASLMLYVEP
ncbi:nuclear transport factor 2 family protein [Sediminicola sp. 1XM1-17]|uniref:nuclear transport factor 2 family protein n=1 Tax=Sediminicola sp. 1XM1-17 TaxID=3127702 RepID=UPI00307850DD